MVLEHKLDCAFVGGEVEHPDLISIEISRETLVLAHAKDAGCDELPLILFREGCVYRARALEWQREQGNQLREVMEFGSLDAILGCVAIGLGCTLMPNWVIEGSRHRSKLQVEKISAHLSHLPTVMIRHRQAIPLKDFETLQGATEQKDSIR